MKKAKKRAKKMQEKIKIKSQREGSHAHKDYPGLRRLQTAQLPDHERKKEPPRQDGNQEVLPFLQQAYFSS